MRLEKKSILVTGSTTGIGEAIARRCVAEGARVLLHGRDEGRGNAIVDELGDRAAFHPADLLDPDAPAKLVAHAVDAFGKLDAVVNNAAWVKRADLDATTPEVFDGVMAVNVRAPMLLIKAARPHLRKTEGCVLNIGSINGFGGETNLLPYSVSKAALMTLSRNLADALSYEHIRVYHFNVGWVLTENEYRYKLDDGLAEDWPQTLPPQSIPAGRMTKPEEIAAIAAFWLSDEARPFSGTMFELEQYPFVGRNPTKTGDD